MPREQSLGQQMLNAPLGINGLSYCCTIQITFELNAKTVPVLPSLDPSLMFPFHLLPSPVHPTGFSFCFFPGMIAYL